MLSSPLILVVENEAKPTTSLRNDLEQPGFRVEEATDGKTALVRIAETKPDLILLSWVLPRMSCIAVCRRIRRDLTDVVPIIVVGTRSDDRNTVEILNAGADAYITWPFNTGILLARMVALLCRAGTTMPKPR